MASSAQTGPTRALDSIETPASLEAEAATLGSMMLDNGCIPDVLELVAVDYFHSPGHRRVFGVISEMFDEGIAVDLVSLSDRLNSRNELEKVGGTDALLQLAQCVPSAASAVHYATLVREKATCRALLAAALDTVRDVQQHSDDVLGLVDRAEARFFQASELQHSGQSLSLGQILQQDTVARVDQLHDRKGRLSGLPTGFFELDDLTAGLQNSELIIVAGRPSMGKSSFALNVAMNIARDQGAPVAIFSMEVSRAQVAMNLLCCQARVNAHAIRRGLLPAKEQQHAIAVAGELASLPIYIDDTPGLSIYGLRAKARRLAQQVGVRCLFVDYLQLMEGSASRADGRQQEITQISRGLKSLSRELNIPVVALSQLNRAVDQREGHKPRMSDLRESGAIEQDADVVMLLYREDYYFKDTAKKPGEAEVIVAKQRNGPTGEVSLVFERDYLRFDNLTVHRPE